MNQIEYVCAECQKPVAKINDDFVRTCEHTEAGIAANLSATAYGIGSVTKE